MRHRRFPGVKGARFHSSNTVDAEFIGSEPVDYGIRSILQEKVYRPRIANVNELETRLIDNWASLTADRGCCFDAASTNNWSLLTLLSWLTGRCAVVSALVSVKRSTL